MYKDYSKLRRWEIIGFFWILILGSLLHFTYEWSGKSPLVGAFSAINESVWEHLKLGYFSLLLFTFIQYWFIKDETNSYFLGKALGIIAMNLFIVVVFYSYNSITGKSIFIIDIASFIVGAAICQALSYKILKSNISKIWNYIGLSIFLLIGLIFVIFTFNPPSLNIFMDPRTKKYGIK